MTTAAKEALEVAYWYINASERDLLDAGKTRQSLLREWNTLVPSLESIDALTPPTAAEVEITNGLKKLEVVKLVLKAASEDVRPAEPHWHNDFLSMAVKRIEEVQSLITAASQKGK
jgi:hypothetical protein